MECYRQLTQKIIKRIKKGEKAVMIFDSMPDREIEIQSIDKTLIGYTECYSINNRMSCTFTDTPLLLKICLKKGGHRCE